MWAMTTERRRRPEGTPWGDEVPLDETADANREENFPFHNWGIFRHAQHVTEVEVMEAETVLRSEYEETRSNCNYAVTKAKLKLTVVDFWSRQHHLIVRAVANGGQKTFFPHRCCINCHSHGLQPILEFSIYHNTWQVRAAGDCLEC